MRKIINPWAGKGIYTCFGCANDNSIGLHMQFYDYGEGLVCNWLPSRNYEGYTNTLHGGIQSTMHDEIASWVVYVKGETAGMTTELKVKYLKSVMVNEGEIKITGRIIEQDRRFIKIHTQLFNNSGDLCSEGEVVYRVFSQKLAIEKMHYPGVDAFYE
ncbi:MAG: PaaI family thioesterase [Salinivirgaceae bacterium]|jgi:uncharacterized protein (TIGR00369 family)|nr:PaaI family thioesterase [Salinivirgaceae bacterium]